MLLSEAVEEDGLHHGFDLGSHFLGGDAVGRLMPHARGSKDCPGPGCRQQRGSTPGINLWWSAPSINMSETIGTIDPSSGIEAPLTEQFVSSVR